MGARERRDDRPGRPQERRPRRRGWGPRRRGEPRLRLGDTGRRRGDADGGRRAHLGDAAGRRLDRRARPRGDVRGAAPDIDVVTERDTGSRLSVSTDERLSAQSEPEELIRQSREEAYGDLGWFGYGSVRYQTDASEKGSCEYCGREADDIVHRHEETVLALFGLHLTVEPGAISDECEYCSVTTGDVPSSEEERNRIYDLGAS